MKSRAHFPNSLKHVVEIRLSPVHDQNEVLPKALAHKEVDEGVEGCGRLAEKTSRVTKH